MHFLLWYFYNITVAGLIGFILVWLLKRKFTVIEAIVNINDQSRQLEVIVRLNISKSINININIKEIMNENMNVNVNM